MGAGYSIQKRVVTAMRVAETQNLEAKTGLGNDPLNWADFLGKTHPTGITVKFRNASRPRGRERRN